MFQEEPHPDIENMTDAEHGAATVADIVARQAKDGIPNLDYDTMPVSTNVEDRRGEATTAARGTGKGGQLFDSGNQDVQELTDYLQHLKDTETKTPEQSTHTHPAETDGTLNRLLANTAAGKIAEWGAYAGLANVAPRVLPAMNALWMGAWIASGHQLREDIAKQVKEGKSISEIKFEKGSLGDMGGIISALQEKYPGLPGKKVEGKPPEGLEPVSIYGSTLEPETTLIDHIKEINSKPTTPLDHSEVKSIEHIKDAVQGKSTVTSEELVKTILSMEPHLVTAKGIGDLLRKMNLLPKLDETPQRTRNNSAIRRLET